MLYFSGSVSMPNSLQAKWIKRDLRFVSPIRTSRGEMMARDCWYVLLTQDGKTGVGECAPLWSLSVDRQSDFENVLDRICTRMGRGETISNAELESFPSIQFGIETARLDLENGGFHLLFDTPFYRGEAAIPINGLIWIGTQEFLRQQIDIKVASGYSVLKMKIGSLGFQDELDTLTYIRETYGNSIEIRLDANGAFDPRKAGQKLEQLAKFNIHSIEQPIQPGQTAEISRLCGNSPIPIALDEELIGVRTKLGKKELLDIIHPQYIILKPSLLGGLQKAEEWVELADMAGIGWWVTSALESNIGLNAIAQWTATKQSALPQGLGTGLLYENNIGSPLEIKNGALTYNSDKGWSRVE